MVHADGATRAPLELWGGVECTVNRVGDQYFDQMEWSGHARRADDLDRAAALGLRTLRYPVLWERVAPEGESCDWSWSDERLGRLRGLGVRPIVGLVHHGSGPRHTNLTEASFAEGLAAFAGRVAGRYPWVDHYTPVNEPLTTARFSGLYGVWHPHGKDGRTFMRALLTQCRAVVLAMRAVRRVRPDARLVQTEDLGKTYATPALAYQAEFENERRWLTFDLLCGRVGRDHPMRSYCRFVGIPEAEVDWFLDNPCPPDVLGVNHYLTSERWLDERLERYPPHCVGGNGRHAYADVEALRVRPEGVAGPRGLLAEAWERYRLPIAVTEAHLGCTREEQMRWLLEVWRAARAVRRAGADVQAVTVWSLFGAHEWDSLVTRPHGHYEPGAFDLRGPAPRPTALAGLVSDLAAGREPGHPVLAAPGWWRRSQRLTFAPEAAAPPDPPAPGRPVLIVGGGPLARAFARLCQVRGLAHRLARRREMDPARAPWVEEALAAFDPWAVVHVRGPLRAALAGPCARRGVALLTLSADVCLDGLSPRYYRECGPRRPEHSIRPGASRAGALVVRPGLLLDPWGGTDYLAGALRAWDAEPFGVTDDIVYPIYAPDLVHACLDLLIDGERGLWRLVNGGPVSRADLVREAARQAGREDQAVESRPPPAAPAGPREEGRSLVLGSWQDAVRRYLLERKQARPAPPALHRDGCDTAPAARGQSGVRFPWTGILPAAVGSSKIDEV